MWSIVFSVNVLSICLYVGRYVCQYSLYVCPLVHLKNHMFKVDRIFYTCYRWAVAVTVARFSSDNSALSNSVFWMTSCFAHIQITSLIIFTRGRHLCTYSPCRDRGLCAFYLHWVRSKVCYLWSLGNLVIISDESCNFFDSLLLLLLISRLYH